MMKKDVEAESDYVRRRICSIAREYSMDRYDSALVAIGSVGERILKRVIPLEEARVFYHAVNHGRHTLAPQRSQNSDVAYIEIYSHKPMEIRIINTTDDPYTMRDFDDAEYPVTKFEITTAEASTSQIERSRTALRVFTEFARSDSYILVSAFGGKYAQEMHTEVSKIMVRRNIPHLNVIVKPSKLYPNERAMAERAISHLQSLGARVKVIDNQDLEESDARNSTRPSSDGQWTSVNTKIAREIEVYLMKLAAASINAKKIVAY